MKVDECVGCGFCCFKAKCGAAVRLYPSAQICPALQWSQAQKRYICSLMWLPGKLGEEYRKELYEGEGCCMNLNTWRQDVKERREIEWPHKGIAVPKIFQMFLSSLGKQWIGGDVLFLTISDFQQELLKNGYVEDEAKEVIKLVAHYIKQNRTKNVESFMG